MPQFVQVKSADWRQTIRENSRRTYFVMVTFVLIYLSVGLFIDLLIHGAFDQNHFSLVLNDLLTLKIIPWSMITMGGVALLAILITFAFYNRIMLMGSQYHEVTEFNAITLIETQLYHIVEELKIAAGLRYMPKIYIMETPEMNAFASGYSEKSAMIVVTRGLLEKLDRSELQAVLAHELSHIRHGDIKLTLMATVLCNIMLIVIDVLFQSIIFSRSNRRKDDRNLIIVIILIRYLLPLLTVVLMLYMSRRREYMADAGAVQLMRDSTPLAHALLKISGDYQQNIRRYNQERVTSNHEDIRQAAYIFDPFTLGFHPMQSILTVFFSTHPPIPARLKALGYQVQKD